jgi:RNA polymerase sigma-70 factor (ECF subfamily)
MQTLTDEQLITAWRSAPPAEQAALLEQLCARHYRRVGLWCLRYTGSRDLALDVSQDVFVTLVRKLHTFQGGSRFTTWLYTLTRNHCLNALQSQSRLLPADEEDQAFRALLDPSPGPEHAASTSDLSRHAKAILAEALDEREQTVFLLHFVEEMPLESITRLLGLTNRSGAKAYIVSAKRKLSVAVNRWRARRNTPRGEADDAA